MAILWWISYPQSLCSQISGQYGATFTWYLYLLLLLYYSCLIYCDIIHVPVFRLVWTYLSFKQLFNFFKCAVSELYMIVLAVPSCMLYNLMSCLLDKQALDLGSFRLICFNFLISNLWTQSEVMPGVKFLHVKAYEIWLIKSEYYFLFLLEMLPTIIVICKYFRMKLTLCS